MRRCFGTRGLLDRQIDKITALQCTWRLASQSKNKRPRTKGQPVVEKRSEGASAEEVAAGVTGLGWLGKTSIGSSVLKRTLDEFDAAQRVVEDGAGDTNQPTQSTPASSPASSSTKKVSLGGGLGSKGTESRASAAAASASSTVRERVKRERRSLLDRLAATKAAEQEAISHTAEMGKSPVARYLLRQRRIDKIGLAVERAATELGAPVRICRGLVNAATLTQMVVGLAKEKIVPSAALVALGLMDVGAQEAMFGPPGTFGEGSCPAVVQIAGRLALLLLWYDVSAYIRYPLMHFVFVPMIRSMTSRGSGQPAAPSKEEPTAASTRTDATSSKRSTTASGATRPTGAAAAQSWRQASHEASPDGQSDKRTA